MSPLPKHLQDAVDRRNKRQTGRIDDGSFRVDLERLINRYSKENGSNTPDFILAGYLDDCLRVFDAAVNARRTWSTFEGRGPEDAA